MHVNLKTVIYNVFRLIKADRWILYTKLLTQVEKDV